MNNEKSEKQRVDPLYTVGYIVLVAFVRLFYGLRIVGRENIPDGSALICANHSNSLDPVYLCAAVDRSQQVHMMAKKEIFKTRLLTWLFKKVGAFPVDRSTADISAIRTTLKYLKSGCKVGIFPEGTRVSQDDSVQAKHGALKLAERSGAPIVPVYIPRKKRLFRRNTVVVGEPYYINPERKKLTTEEYDELAAELMRKINGLRNSNT